MRYVVTGATGFVGRNLVERLAARGGEVLAVVRAGSEERFGALADRLGPRSGQLELLPGDLTQPDLGITPARLAELGGSIDHVVHVGAVYDVTASPEAMRVANVDGTRHAVRFAAAVRAGRFHHISSIAVAGRYRGVFTEDMFDEAEDLDRNAYYRTKHDAERVVREECQLPWRVYRPGVVVGDSRTGEIDKIDGPYFFFRLISRARYLLPGWMPLVGPEGRPVPLVPVDFVADAVDHLMHAEGLDARAFHLVDPAPRNAGEVINIFAAAAHAPTMRARVDPKLGGLVPVSLRRGLASLKPVRDAVDGALDRLGIPREALSYVTNPTRFDCAQTQAALAGTGIAVPPLESYAARLWDYWERNLDPALFHERNLGQAVRGKVVLVTGASSGIGREVALRVGEAGGIVVLVARTAEKLEATRAEIDALGGEAHVMPCDLSDLADIDRMAEAVLDQHGRVDVLVNNAGRSIRRSVALSYDRFHDYERTMALNYFGAIRLILRLLPGMRRPGYGGHIINISSVGVQTSPPRFAAYLASKAALDAFSRSVASEVVGDGVDFTTIHMPLVRTPMIAPSTLYQAMPAYTPEQAGALVTRAMIDRPKRVSTRLGNFGQLAYAVSPRLVDVVLHQAYKLFPDSSAARGKEAAASAELTEEATAFAYLFRGVHW